MRHSSTPIQVPIAKGQLHGVLETPVNNAKTPLVIIMHGRRSNKNREGYIDIAKIAHSLGYETLRFDFRGHGDSYDSPNWQSYGVVDQLSDLLAILEHTNRKEYILIGSSFSSEAALLATARMKEVSMAIMISPGLGKNSSGSQDNRYRKVWWDKAKNTTQIPFNQYVEELRKITQPVHSLHGTADESVPIKLSEELENLIGTNFQLHRIKDGKHKYTEPTDAMKQRQNILEILLS